MSCVIPLKRGSAWVGTFTVTGQVGGDKGTFSLTGNNGGSPFVTISSDAPNANGSTLDMVSVSPVAWQWTVNLTVADVELVEKYRCQYHLTLDSNGTIKEVVTGWVTVEDGVAA